ncbi:MAG: hypothetical protein ACRC68_07425 [Clostridium sp.]
MSLKEKIFTISCLIGFCMAFLGEDAYISAIGISIIYMCFIGGLIYSVLKWNKNKKNITGEYVSINIENFAYEILVILYVYKNIRDKYNNRRFELEYLNDEIVIINNFKDFINSYEAIEKIVIYMTIGLAFGAVILLIKKFVCRGRISSEEIIFGNGDIIKLKDIKEIKIGNGLWTFTKNMEIILEKSNRIISLSNKNFAKVKENLENSIICRY